MGGRVSVVIPVLNREDLVTRCLDSVWAQTLRPLDVIVVDNNSTDGTLQRVADWGDARSAFSPDSDFRLRILTEPTPGASAARNRGLAEVETEYTIFFDSDDEMMPVLAESALAAIGDADIVYWRGDVVGIDGWVTQKPFHRGDLLMRHVYNALLSTQLYMARTSVFRDAGGWNEEAAVWNDWEIGFRILLGGPRAVALDETLTRIHAQRESITGTSFSGRAGEWERTLDIMVADVERSGLGPRARKRLRRMLLYRGAILAAHYRAEGAEADADRLMDRILDCDMIGFVRKTWLCFLHHYTALGGRGAYYLWR